MKYEIAFFEVSMGVGFVRSAIPLHFAWSRKDLYY
jgi:hypothetical protein